MKNLFNCTYHFIVPLIFCFFLGCSDDSNEKEVVNDFRGEYKIIDITSSVSIDLNNDGVKSNNYFAEFQSGHVRHNGEIVNFGWNLNEPGRYAIARPTATNGYKIQFLDINFPKQRISPLFIGNDTFVDILMEYRAMRTWLIYILENGQVRIDPTATQDFQFHGITNFNIKRLNVQTFEIKFNMNIYDFVDKTWVNSEITTTYSKV